MMNNRIDRFRALFDNWNVDAVLITSPTNRRWLSGFSGSAGTLLISYDKAILSTDSRYWEQAGREAPQFRLYYHRNERNDLRNFLESGAVRHIGIEAKHLTVSDWNGLQHINGFSWSQLEMTAEVLRVTKSPEEIEAIRRAAIITDQTVAWFQQNAKPGITEKALAWELEKFMRQAGADRPGFDIIVASGPNSALPHHHPGDRVLQEGDAVIVDLGAEVAGYKSDLTRTFFLGETASERFAEVYNTVLEAQQAAINGIKADIFGKEVDAFARDIIEAAGYGENFGHGTGHSVGMDIHENPRLSRQADKDVLPAGAVVTVEPGIYIPGWGGVRIEDLILITTEGPEYLSHAPKSPVIPIT
jgi:Xaa-Pro aminopeptidase